jgi:hypothetical protein
MAGKRSLNSDDDAIVKDVPNSWANIHEVCCPSNGLPLSRERRNCLSRSIDASSRLVQRVLGGSRFERLEREVSVRFDELRMRPVPPPQLLTAAAGQRPPLHSRFYDPV